LIPVKFGIWLGNVCSLSVRFAAARICRQVSGCNTFGTMGVIWRDCSNVVFSGNGPNPNPDLGLDVDVDVSVDVSADVAGENLVLVLGVVLGVDDRLPLLVSKRTDFLGVTGSGVTGSGVTGSGVTGSGVTGSGVTGSEGILGAETLCGVEVMVEEFTFFKGVAITDVEESEVTANCSAIFFRSAASVNGSTGVFIGGGGVTGGTVTIGAFVSEFISIFRCTNRFISSFSSVVKARPRATLSKRYGLVDLSSSRFFL